MCVLDFYSFSQQISWFLLVRERERESKKLKTANQAMRRNLAYHVIVELNIYMVI